jgi:hypothetical protein
VREKAKERKDKEKIKKKEKGKEKEVGNRKQYYNMDVIDGSQKINRCVEPR